MLKECETCDGYSVKDDNCGDNGTLCSGLSYRVERCPWPSRRVENKYAKAFRVFNERVSIPLCYDFKSCFIQALKDSGL